MDLASAPDATDEYAEHDRVWRVLLSLPERQRAVLVLRYYEGLTDPEIAACLRCARGTVRSLAARAFAALRVDPALASVGETDAAVSEVQP